MAGDPKKYALIYDSTILNYATRNPPCTTRVLNELIRPVGYGMMLPKNSPYTKVFDTEILELRDSGYMETLATHWIYGPCPSYGRPV